MYVRFVVWCCLLSAFCFLLPTTPSPSALLAAAATDWPAGWLIDLRSYEETAVALGSGLDRLWAIRKQLEEVRATSPLFDTQGTVRSLEKAMNAMWSKYEWGAPADHIDVPE